MAKETGIAADPGQRIAALLRRMIRHTRYTASIYEERWKEIATDYRRVRATLPEGDRGATYWRHVALVWIRWSLAWIGYLAKRIGQTIWRHSRGVAGYYWSQRQRFGDYALEFFEGLQEPKKRQREVRLSPSDDLDAAKYKKGSWNLEMPARCFLCSEPTDQQPETLFVRIEDVAGPFWCLCIGIVGGPLFALINGAWWPLLAGVGGGALIGYQCRRFVDVRIQLRWCTEHAERAATPAMRVFSDQLIVRIGNKTVRQEFRQTGFDKESTMLGLYASPPVETVQTPIQLAEGSDTPIKPERTIPLAGSEPEDKNGEASRELL